MTPNERFHRLLYLTVQRLRGRPLGAYIRRLQEWERLEPEAFQRLRAQRLARTLEYARTHIPLYRSGPWQEAFRRSGAGDLRSWPVLEREIIQSSGAALLAKPTPRGLYYRTSSGSTGQPLRVGADPDGAAWVWANEYRGLLWHGIGVCARSLSLRRRGESALAEWIRNQTTVPTGDLSPRRLDDAVRFLLTRRPTYVWGFPSAVAELARHARLTAGGAPRPLVPFAKVFGEMLYPAQRQEIEEGLGTRVIETYGCQETGSVAYECPAGSLHIFAEHVEMEILRHGEPAEPGETGDIVLTCTTNRMMPLIRYRVGDLGRLSPDPCSCGRPHPVMAGIEGRTGELLLTAAGDRLHGGVLSGVLKKASAKSSPTAIGRVLFEQHDLQTWTILVQTGPGYDDSTSVILADGVKSIFGQECRVAVKQVVEIPREPFGQAPVLPCHRASLRFPVARG
ncbi:MAG: phenylacetate--CoA ligase family protein [Gemmatimonadales bacterium]